MDENYQGLVRGRLRQLEDEIRQILVRVGDPNRRVRVTVVTKYIGVEEMRDLVMAGVTVAGENRWQIARDKVFAFPQVEWHFIGPLQRNKARHVARHFAWVQSVDRVEVATELAKHAREFGKTITVLVQVNISGEQQKSGVALEQAGNLVVACKDLDGINVEGLMGIARNAGDEQTLRREFGSLRTLRDSLREQTGLALPELSMGMSEDYVVALEEGATMLRIGRKLI